MTALQFRVRGAHVAAILALLAMAAATSSCTTTDGPATAAPKPTGYEQQLGGRFVVCADCDHPTRKTIATVRATPVTTHITVLAPAASAPQAALNIGAWAPPAERQTAAASAPSDGTLHQRATIEFRFGTAELNPTARAKLTRLTPLFQAATRIRMLGFTDDVGPQGPNDKLAAERAMAVHLFVRGLLHDQLTPVLTSRGDALCCYLTDNRNEAQRSVNRRVEVLVSLPANAKSQDLVRQLARLLVPTGELAGDAKRYADARPIAAAASSATTSVNGALQ
jgi:outer membrane protein OmpA-like peptidoglycan-associated protein